MNTAPLIDPIVERHGAGLLVLTGKLRPKAGPIFVTFETWSDGRVVARLPAARLYGEGASEADAMDALAEKIEDFWETAAPFAKDGNLGGVVALQWALLQELAEAS